MGRVVAVFDFDGTLIKGDSFIMFARFAVGWRHFVKALIKSAPWLVLWKAGLLSNAKAKQRLFSALYKGMTRPAFERLGESFSAQLESVEIGSTVKALGEHISNGDTVYIVTASPAEWVRPWAVHHGVSAGNILATPVGFSAEKGSITGRFAGNNCYGPEKVRRLLAKEPDRRNYTLIAYGDSRGDREMAQFADKFIKVDSDSEEL